MNRSINLVIPLLIAALTATAWWLLNQPSEEPPWPNRIQGFSFAPMRADDDPSLKKFPSVEDIDADLALLEGRAHAVRTYTVEDTLADIPRLAAGHGLNVTLGGWIGAEPAANEIEIKRLAEVLNEGHRNLVRVIVGNESILRRDLPVSELIGYLDRVRKLTWLPVSTAEPWHVWLK